MRALRARIRPHLNTDIGTRAALLRTLRSEHPRARIVAFTAHAATAEALFRTLRNSPAVALLTARGARTAGGARARADVIDALGADRAGHRSPAHDDISLVITTDLLSEGVNLQGASVVVHLDLPWTAAGLDQRVGRAARMGSQHQRVHVYGIATPAAAEQLLTLDRRLRRKRSAQLEAARVPLDIERLRRMLEAWRGGARDDLAPSESLVATTRGAISGFIAAIAAGAERSLVCGVFRGKRGWTLSDSPADLCEIVRGTRVRAAKPDSTLEAGARAALGRWLSRSRAQQSSGGRAASSRGRRLLLDRLDSAVRTASVSSRASLAQRLVRLRTLIRGAVTAGAERTLDDLAHFTGADLESWLTRCETELVSVSPRAVRDENEPPALCALLLLRRDP